MVKILEICSSCLAEKIVKNTDKVDEKEHDIRPFMIRWLNSLGAMVLYAAPAYVLSC
ncbi:MULTISPECIES: hypothetical protein [unclassified Niallia]|uniref:hypothetical protein n=1 Tax=unclassified Niallia TaxID=2837522 RepID=UPI002043AA4C|nr:MULTISPECIES: hypothetical protein [unclassified Niallia]UPO90569.1 hypothetical protein L8T27_021200 [Niallia sp. Man26]